MSTSLSTGTCIGANVVIGPNCVLENCVIYDDVQIGAGSILRNTIVGAGTRIGPRFTAIAGACDVKLADGLASAGVRAHANVETTHPSSALMRPEIHGWWRQAQADLKTAGDSLQAENFYAVAFFAHQASEKALKALYLSSEGKPHFGHGLVFLARARRARRARHGRRGTHAPLSALAQP